MQDEDLATYAWCERTGGALTRGQRRALLRASLRDYATHGAGLANLLLGRRSTEVVPLPAAPDEELVAAALEVAAEQGRDLEGHGLRTWLFGSALAAVDGVHVDADLLCVAGIVHDAGGATPVPGEDFTIRSAQLGVRAFAHAGRPLSDDLATQLRDGIVAHATAGINAEGTPLGAYVQAGALLDLAGIRLVDLPAETVHEVVDRHPHGTVRDTVQRLIRDEARAVPDGRFAQLHRLGLGLAVRFSPTLRRSIDDRNHP